MNKYKTPRLPTEEEFNELCCFELSRLDPNGGPDAGDLGFMLKDSSIAVFDHFDQKGSGNDPQIYRGKYMMVVWGLRLISEYVWINNRIVLVDETNRKEIW